VRALIVLAVVAAALWLYWRAAEEATKTRCRDNLKQLGLAFHNYHHQFGSFPPAYVKGKDGRPAHSWRVLLLPFLGRQDLYDAYHFDEPWDGPNNAPLVEQMPAVFACPPGSGGTPGRTSYVAVVGSQTMWPGHRAVRIQDVTDGLSNTIQLIEIADSDISWTEPRDVLLRELLPPGEDGVGSRFGSAHKGVVNFLFGDGRVGSFEKPFQGRKDRQVLSTLLTAYGGQPYRGEWLPGEEALVAGEFPPEKDASQLRATDVTPHLEDRVAAERNYVYCATFQIAWDDLRQAVGMAPEIEGNPGIAAGLNRIPFPRSALSPASFVARMGLVRRGIQEAIRQEMAQKFPNVTPSFTAPAAETDVIAYAFLQKNLPFAVNFDVLPEPLEFHATTGDVPVKAFGFKALADASGSVEMLKQQVTVLHYESDAEFVIRLKPHKDEIILAKVRPAATLADTLQAVQRQVRERAGKVDRPTPEDKDTLAIPMLALNVLRRYDQLIGKRLQNPGWTDSGITEARQVVRFLLNETGTRVESEVEVGMWLNGHPTPPPPPKPRRFVLDKPFLLYMKESGAEQPYLVLWVANAEIMQKSR
jgi:prepilin-type processing-associated H-X9-DG protein